MLRVLSALEIWSSHHAISKPQMSENAPEAISEGLNLKMPPDPPTGCAATHTPMVPPNFLKVLFCPPPPLSVFLNETLKCYMIHRAMT